MTITIGLIAVIAIVAIWWLSRQRLAAKPWLEEGAIEEVHNGGARPMPAAKLGLGVFLAVVASLFALLASAYSIRMQMPDWQSIPVPWLLWLNTGLLIGSSVALQWAHGAARRGRIDSVRDGLLAGGATALVFLVGQVLAFRDLSAAGVYLASNPASSFFYLITTLHGLHLLGGVVALGRTAAAVWRRVDLERMPLSVELCALYWHFLLFVWIVFFALVLNT